MQEETPIRDHEVDLADLIGAILFGAILFLNFADDTPLDVPWTSVVAGVFGWCVVGLITGWFMPTRKSRVSTANGAVVGVVALVAYGPSLLDKNGWEFAFTLGFLALAVALVCFCVNDLRTQRAGEHR